MPSTKPSSKLAIEPGFIVAVTLPPHTAPLRSYVGEVQAADSVGIRITLVDWLSGTFTGCDLFIPWTSVQSALVGTPAHDVNLTQSELSRWQNAMNDKS